MDIAPRVEKVPLPHRAARKMHSSGGFCKLGSMQPELARPAAPALTPPLLPPSELVGFGLLVFAFATLITIHVALAYRVGRLGSRWRGLLALLVPPVAPLAGFLLGLRLLPSLWTASAVGYLIALARALS
mgnify:CR=1 FL=1|jgi:hypothetical protein